MRACAECGTPTVEGREPFRYTLGGGWSATVENCRIRRCPKCGAYEVSIEKAGPLQDALAAAVLAKPTGLAAEEVTFLRLHLGMNGRELARTLGITTAALSRWETGKHPIGPQSDRALRMLVALLSGGAVTIGREELGRIAEGDGAPMRLVARLVGGKWVAVEDLRKVAP